MPDFPEFSGSISEKMAVQARVLLQTAKQKDASISKKLHCCTETHIPAENKRYKGERIRNILPGLKLVQC